MKRVFIGITALTMMFVSTFGSFTVRANEYEYIQNEPSVQNDIYMEGTNTFGNMLASELSAKQAEAEDNEGYNVTSVEMAGNIADVGFATRSDAALVVGIYSEDGNQLIASGYKEVLSGDSQALVEIETAQMPQYYYVKAFLIDSDTMRPWCEAFECPTYTRKMQEFLQKTVNDFPADRVLNLDTDLTNNFAVYNNETKLVQSYGETNKIVTADDTNRVYVIENAGSEITSLKPGDVFAHTYNNDLLIIVKIASIRIDGATVTITGDELSCEDVFEYIKIDESTDMNDCTVDTSNMDSALTYNGMADRTSPAAYRAIIDEDDTFSKGVKFEIDFKIPSNYEGTEAHVKGSLNYLVKSHYKVYYDVKIFDKDPLYVEFTSTQSMGIAVSASGEMAKEKEMALPTIYLHNSGFLTLEVKSKVVLKTTCELEFSCTIEKTDGFSYDNETGKYINLSSEPESNFDFTIEGTVYFGLNGEISLNINLLNQKFASAGLYGGFGVEVSSKKNLADQGIGVGVKHDCSLCLDGDINFKTSLSAKLKVLNFLSVEKNIISASYKIGDFYISNPYGFGIGNCPHLSYCLTVAVTDEQDKPVEGIEVFCNGTQVTTGTDGKAQIYIPAGRFEVSVFNNFYETSKTKVHMGEAPKEIVVQVKMKGSKPDKEDPTTPSGEIKFKQVSLGANHSAALTENGDLYMWGRNNSGQLGNGTTIASNIPIKIMSNIDIISLGGSSSAAVTTNGDLYMWGNNDYGQIGDGTTDSKYSPIKILNNVSFISLGSCHSAAITSNGDLYMWGNNYYGQLGNNKIGGEMYSYDKEIDSAVPIKIMDNVLSVSLGGNHSAAITMNNELFTWGYNHNGQLGNSRTSRSSIPKKIMDNVLSVNLGYAHSAAITKKGELYTWGYNFNGQLGNNEKRFDFDAANPDPIKIMNNVTSVNLGNSHSASLTVTNELYTWGYNNGTLGDGGRSDSLVPIKIMDNIRSVDLGSDHSAAITQSGDLYMWGSNSNGQLGNGSTTRSYLPIKITIPQTSTQTMDIPVTMNAYSLASSPRTFTGLKPNKIYNIYGMKSDTAEKPFSADNLLYISQTVTDSSGTLVFDYLPDEEYANPKIFVREIIGDTVTQPTYMKGDVNGDGKITAVDLILVRRYLVHMISDISPAADMNGDNKINAVDLILLRRLYIGA